MRILAACSLGGAGHFNPLVAFLHAAHLRGDDVLTVGPPALRELVESAGFPFRAGGEPYRDRNGADFVALTTPPGRERAAPPRA